MLSQPELQHYRTFIYDLDAEQPEYMLLNDIMEDRLEDLYSLMGMWNEMIQMNLRHSDSDMVPSFSSSYNSTKPLNQRLLTFGAFRHPELYINRLGQAKTLNNLLSHCN
jgi:hypothetical protein